MYRKQLITFILLFQICQPQNQPKLQRYADLQADKEKCRNQSQNLKIRYEKNLVSHGLQYVCQDQAYRTCCTKSGFDQIMRERAIMMSKMEQQENNNCMFALQELLCYDCDGDIGLGVKKGLCKGYCQNLYNQCSENMFIFSDLNKVRFCKEDDLLCSRLKDITDSSEEFCKYLGFKVNENQDYVSYVKSLSDKNQEYEASCYDGVASYQLYGRAKQTKYQPKNDSYKQSHPSDWYYKILYNPYFQQYFPIIFAVCISFLGFILFICFRRSNSQKTLQQLIDEQERKQFIERHKQKLQSFEQNKESKQDEGKPSQDLSQDLTQDEPYKDTNQSNKEKNE